MGEEAGDLRRVEMPGGRTLRIRRLSAQDAAGLLALFEGLNEEDLYRRFFSAHAPPERFIERMARVEEHGGVGLVAELEQADGTSRIVAEASANPLPNGNGELGITVTEGARGWLGPYLLDALLEAADQRGMPNVEADVLITNRRMLTLLRSRGYAVVDEGDQPVILRVIISTTGRVPGWRQPKERPRLLVEAPGGHWRTAKAARQAGLEVLTCPGPLRGWSQCPARRGEPCPLAAQADVIVDAVPGAEGQALLSAHHRMHPAVPVCVEVRGTEDEGRPPDSVVIPAGSAETVVVGLLQRLAAPGGTDEEDEATPVERGEG